MEVKRRWKKSAIGASTITLVPSTVGGDGGGAHPSHIAPTQIVITYPSTPPSDLWGTVTTDGIEYVEIIRRVT